MPATVTTTQQPNPFIKQLASSDRQTRDRALSSLRTYLHRSTPFTPLDFLKLWKGLFYCMWMSDKPRNQQRLARDLADLVDVLSTQENLLGLLDGFWKTMAREWGNIDALRMDKYLYLVRCCVNKGFELCANHGWRDGELLEEYLQILEAVPFNAKDDKIPNGLRYHVMDLYVDELDKVDGERKAPVDMILAPLRRLGSDTPVKTVRIRVVEALDDERLSDWRAAGAGAGNIGAVEDGQTISPADADQRAVADDDEQFTGFGD